MYSSVVHVQWESTTEQNIMMSAKWCHGCATLYMPQSTNQCLCGDFVSSGCKQIDQTTGHIA